MMQIRADAMLGAARALTAVGRIASAGLFLDRVRAGQGGETVLRAAIATVLARPDLVDPDPAGPGVQALGFAEACLDALGRQPGPQSNLPADLPALRAAVLDRRPMDAAAFRALCAAIPDVPSPGRAGGGQEGSVREGAGWEGPPAYVLNTSLPRDGTGYSTRSQGLVRALMALGVEMHCVTRAGSPAAAVTTPAAPPETHDGVTYHRLTGGDWCGRWDRGHVRRAQEACIAHFRRVRPRVVIAASNHINAVPACLAARQLGLPFVYDVRGFWELSLAAVQPGYAGSPAQQVATALESALAAEADLVFTLNAPMRDELIRRGTRPERITLLPNAVDPARFTPRPRDPALAARLGLPAQTPVIGYVGSFNSYEALDDLVAACALLHERGRDFRLVLVGDEPGHLRDRVLPGLHAIIGRAGMADKVHLPGRVPAAEAEAWYSLIDIAPVPRRSTAVTRLVSPLKPFEAMAMEKTVVLSDLPPLTEILTHGETGMLFPAGDVAALAGVLETLAGDAALRQRLGHAARAHVQSQRDWKAVAALCRDSMAALAPG